MLIVIAGLALVVVYLASKPVPGDGNPSNLPPPSSIPATGTSGVPSPAASLPGPHGWGAGVSAPGGMALLGTNAGQLAAQTNGSLPATTWVGRPPLPSGVVSSGPQSAPLESKELFTGVKSLTRIGQSSNLTVGAYRKIWQMKWWVWLLLIGGGAFAIGLAYKRKHPLSVNAMGGGNHATTWSDAIRNAFHFSGDGGLFGKGSAPTTMGTGQLITNPDGTQTMSVNMIGAKV